LANFSGEAPVGFTKTGDRWVAGGSGVLSFSPIRRTSMGVYFQKGRGWRVDFQLNGKRHTLTWFKTKAKARQAEAKKREELKNPPPATETPTDMAFLELVNLRLDYVKAYKSQKILHRSKVL
jgi:hypothetical protein